MRQHEEMQRRLQRQKLSLQNKHLLRPEELQKHLLLKEWCSVQEGSREARKRGCQVARAADERNLGRALTIEWLCRGNTPDGM
jgi:hypothetical protein